MGLDLVQSSPRPKHKQDGLPGLEEKPLLCNIRIFPNSLAPVTHPIILATQEAKIRRDHVSK
jgi:hypothetical protein